MRDSLRRAATQALAPVLATGASSDGKAFTCFCEDVTAKDVHRGVQEGYDSIELCKRFTTVTMGPCQGRMCQLSSIRLMSAETGQGLEQIGTTTARPPWSTVPLGALAGRPIEPAKRSAIHGVHRELGASIKWAGDWRRAYDYGDPEGEALGVHEAAGLIDVSTLGKLLVRGPQAGEFLDRLYPNRLSNLKPGRVRYGVLTSDAGRIMDDGTISRIDEDTFYVTTTSSGAGAVEQWFSWWLADWRLDVQLSDVTQALCAVNLAGPRAREILARLTDADCSPEAFAYLDSRHARVAGVRALLMRIGFVGELGYEIHFPAAYGEDVWNAILLAGEADGIRPFGLEPQRILRLQKQHIIVGQDTDSESTPFGAGMPWAVKLDKDEAFIGRWALAHVADAPAETALVGFTRGRRPRADGGRGRARSARPRGRTGDERAPLAPARSRDRHGVGAERARQRRAEHHDLRQRRARGGFGRDRAVLRPGRGAAALVSLAFLTPDAASSREVRARSPMERLAVAAGARLARVEGWNVPNAYSEPSTERGRLTRTVGFVDRSSLAKLEVQAEPRELARIVAQASDGWRSSRGSPADPRSAIDRDVVVPGDARPRARCSASRAPRGRTRRGDAGGRRCSGHGERPRRHVRPGGAVVDRAGRARAARALLRARRATGARSAKRLPSRLGRTNARLRARRSRGPTARARRLGAGRVPVAGGRGRSRGPRRRPGRRRSARPAPGERRCVRSSARGGCGGGAAS